MLMTVPFDDKKNIGREYNRLMENTSEEWLGFQDHDTLFLTPHWKKQFEDAIENAENPGFISCMTNRIGCPLQKASDVDRESNDINYHRQVAEEKFNKYGSKLVDITDSKFNPSALIFATSKKAWQEVGGFKNGFLGVDTTYGGLLKEAGYKIYLLPGLYVYHWYRHKPKIGPKQEAENTVLSKIQTAVKSGKYLITVSHDTCDRDNIDGLNNEDSRADNLQHWWRQKSYSDDDIQHTLEHIKQEHIAKKQGDKAKKLWARK